MYVCTDNNVLNLSGVKGRGRPARQHKRRWPSLAMRGKTRQKLTGAMRETRHTEDERGPGPPEAGPSRPGPAGHPPLVHMRSINLHTSPNIMIGTTRAVAIGLG